MLLHSSFRGSRRIWFFRYKFFEGISSILLLLHVSPLPKRVKEAKFILGDTPNALGNELLPL